VPDVRRCQGANMKPTTRDVAAIMAEMSMVRDTLRRFRLTADVVDDLAQDVAIAMWRAIDRGSYVLVHDATGLDRLGGYMRGITYNVAASHSLKAASRKRLAAIDAAVVGHDVASPDPHARLVAREQLRWARGLPQHLRVPLWCFSNGMTVAETAAALGLPYGAVWSRLRKARKLLGWWLRQTRR
jgi:DNA-directed RNA polymerase specialized sigma24 family protein